MNPPLVWGSPATRIRPGWRAALCLFATLAIFASAALAVDTDGDGVADDHDNCIDVANADQRDTNHDGYGNVCDADFNGNGIIDPTDFSVLKSALGSTSSPDQDLNGNGIVDPADFSKVKTTLGQAPGPSWIDSLNTPNVIVEASVSGDPAPGAVLNAMGDYVILDGSTYISSNWSTGEGAAASFSDPSSDNPTVTLGDEGAFAANLIQVLKRPPITEDNLPPDLKLQPINEIEKGLQDRNQVVAINPFALEQAEVLTLVYSVTTTSGTYTAEVELTVHMPWHVNPGLKTVPVNVPVLLLAKCGEERNETTGEYECIDQTDFSWVMVEKPALSTATLTNPNARTPWFSPDRVGIYRLQETNGSGADIMVHAGRYRGVIDPLLTLYSLEVGDGRPVADETCTGCHAEGGAAPDNFASWRHTGHAEAFTQGITTNDHFGERCFACHAVGFGQDDAGGIDNTPNYENFLDQLADSQAIHDISDNWEIMLMDFPDTARLSNIQCESCHGPQDYTMAHRDQPGAPRVSIAADVCASCHGEPARHGRFEQWQLSNHADYDLARERGSSSGNCSRCHSGNGFIAWNRLDFDPDEDVTVTWDEDSVHPQTCAACHNPHDTGSTSGSDETNAKVRIMGNTHPLIAGFQAISVGKGATCMTCHNSRRGLRNDTTWDSLSDGEKDDIPHHGVQADLIMGQNVYFVPTGVRGKHSMIEDTCVTCHMNKTQPPDILSYNQAGTNHTFAADPNICAECHDSVTADNVTNVVNGYLEVLAELLSENYWEMMASNYPVDIDGCGVADAGNQIVEVVWERPNRLNITLQDGSVCSRADPDDITVSGGAQTLWALSQATYSGDLEKAGWNYYMAYEDEGRGVHNPDFTLRFLSAAINAVNTTGIALNSLAPGGEVQLGDEFKVKVD